MNNFFTANLAEIDPVINDAINNEINAPDERFRT